MRLHLFLYRSRYPKIQDGTFMTRRHALIGENAIAGKRGNAA
jgi:hypothetical protein